MRERAYGAGAGYLAYARYAAASFNFFKGSLNNYRIQFTISFFIAGETPAYQARIRMIQTFLNHIHDGR